MNATVRDVMNSQLVYLAADVRPEIARQHILQFGITAVPVVDDLRKPIGVVSLRDLADPRASESPVSEPARTIGIDESVASAARSMVDAGVHHLVVVDEEGCVAGMVSTLDVIRAFLGMEPQHPRAIDAFKKPPTDASQEEAKE